MILDTTSKLIEAKCGEADVTTQCEYTTAYEDISVAAGTFVPGASDGSLNSTTNVTLVASPAGSTQRRVKEISIYNADTVNHTVTVSYYDGTNTEILVYCTITPGQTLWYGGGSWTILFGATGNTVIIGGTIDNTIIGGTTPAAGTFTTLKETTAPGATDNSDAVITSAWATSNLVSSALAQSLTAAEQAQAGENIAAGIQGNSLGSVNKFRNPGFDVAQRGTSGTVSAGNTAYTLDGWQISATGAGAAWSQVFASVGYGNALKIACASGLTACTLQARIESFIASQLFANKTTVRAITVTFPIYNATGATITAQIATGYASSQDSFGTVTSDLSATNLQSVANGAYGTLSYTFIPNVNLYLGYQIQLQFGGALNAASGYVAILGADIRATPGVTTGQNNTPPPVDIRPIAIEMPFNQRYYETSYNMGVAPGTASTVGALSMLQISSTNVAIQVPFKEPKRSTPTMVYYSPATGTSGKVAINNAATDVGASSSGALGEFGDTVGNASGSLSSTEYVYVHFAASSEL
jgi:hypothetical protein